MHWKRTLASVAIVLGVGLMVFGYSAGELHSTPFYYLGAELTAIGAMLVVGGWLYLRSKGSQTGPR